MKYVDASACSLGSYTWIEIAMDDYGPIFWGAEETGLIYDCGNESGVEIGDIPYVNQRWDTGDSFDGAWACGPTSSVMAMAWLQKIKPKPINTSSPWLHSNDYGWYDSNIYTSPTGFVFNAMQLDASGRPAYGAWGSCTQDGEAWAYLIQDYVQNHGGLRADFSDTTTFDQIKAAIDAGHAVIQSTEIEGAGHLVCVRGYTSDGKVIVNDPWGDANLPNWGIYPNGADVVYTMEKLAAKWNVIVVPTGNPLEVVRAVPAPKDPKYSVPARKPPQSRR